MALVTLNYKPRAWQEREHYSLKRFTVMVIHRRAGKTYFAAIELIRRIFSCPLKRPQVAYIAPTYGQAKRVCWTIIKDLISGINGVTVNESELRVDFPNGGRLLVLGAENPDSLRGIYLDYVVLDEVAEMPATLWEAVVRPTLSDRQGGALFIGTPKGKNYFHDLYLKGKSGEKDWKSTLLTWKDTQAILSSEIDSLKRELEDSVFEQEYECSFIAAIKGAYFGKQMSLAENEGRITTVQYDPDYPVLVSWDIGLDGIALWYAQVSGRELRVIDFDFLYDKEIKDALNIILNKPYIYECQYLPHDAVKTSVINKNLSAEGEIKHRGLRVKVLERLSKSDSIRLGNDLLKRAVFDLKKCTKFSDKKVEVGLESIRQYRAEMDEATGLMKESQVKSIHNHPADAWCVLAHGIIGYNKLDALVDFGHRQVKRKISTKVKQWNVHKRFK